MASPTCAQAAAERDAALLVAAFRAARLRHEGAEGCLTRQAFAQYDDSRCQAGDLAKAPGPIVLYPCAGHTVTAIPDESIEYIPGDPVLVQVDVDLSGENEFGTPIQLPEHLTIGRGTATGGNVAAQVITDARSL